MGQEELQQQLDDITSAINTGWVLICAFLVFWEQAGFAMWEAGSLRKKNLHNILLKNIVDSCISGVAFYAIGYTIAFGDGGNAFIGGGSDLFLAKGADYASFTFQWAFAATAATTVSGCVAERVEFVAYLVYSFFITAFMYPVVVYWVWADDGWLTAWGDNAVGGQGMIDFAGSGVVHMLGGVAGLVGSMILGPRLGRFDGSVDPREFRGHSIALTTLGVYCLWFGWFGFNAGYTLMLTGGMHQVAALVCANTILSPSFAAVTCLAIERYMKGIYDLESLLNATVAGLVGITGSVTLPPVSPRSFHFVSPICLIPSLSFHPAHFILSCQTMWCR